MPLTQFLRAAFSFSSAVTLSVRACFSAVRVAIEELRFAISVSFAEMLALRVVTCSSRFAFSVSRAEIEELRFAISLFFAVIVPFREVI